MTKKKIIIMGAAGRDFHNFNTVFKWNTHYEVVAFTATQIPHIENRLYPPILSGPLYKKGIPIYPESKLPSLINDHRIDTVVFAYSDVSHEYVMHQASLVLSLGANFLLLGTHDTTLKSTIPVISICAVRTGAGKSQTARKILSILRSQNKRVVIVRHPMPYGDLEKQILQRFASYDDFTKQNCTLEEREEFEHYITLGACVYAGIDYQKILTHAEKEADVIIWDGGNNDFSFYRPDLHIVVADAIRPGHELTYHPGETNIRLADIILINKSNEASQETIQILQDNIKSVNKQALILETNSLITIDSPDLIAHKRVAIIEDGPSITHGGLPYGAGYLAAKKYHSTIVSPKEYAVGSLQETFHTFPHIHSVIPSMGYTKTQLTEIVQTIKKMPIDAVILGTPVDLSRLVSLPLPFAKVSYELQEKKSPTLSSIITSNPLFSTQ